MSELSEYAPRFLRLLFVLNMFCVSNRYAKDVDVDLSKRAVQAVSKIAVKLPAVAEHALDRLISFLDFGLDYITSTGQ